MQADLRRRGSSLGRKFVIAGAVVLGLATLAGGATLGVLNGTFNDATVFLALAAVMTCAGVGAFLALRLPRNPIGWLFLAAGLGIILGGVSSDYAIYALQTDPGSLPFGQTAAWISNWAFVGVGVIPLILVLFPTGHVPSPRWRWFPPAFLTCLGLVVLTTMFRPGVINLTTGTQIPNPYAIDGLEGAFDVAVWVTGLGLAALAIAAAVALVQRFRSATGEERQQLRWLAAIASLTGIALITTLLTSIGLQQGETRPVNDLAFFVFFVCLGVGIPAACAVAILKYHLYDLDIVVRKTVVFAIVAGFITLLYLGALAVATLASIGAIAGAVLFVLTFNPVRRRAKALADRVVYGKRATPFEVLSEFSANLGETYSVDDVLPRMTQLLAASTGASDVRVWLRRGPSLTEIARWPSEAPQAPERVLDGDALPTFGGDISAFRVTHGDELLGAITVQMPANDPMDSSKERLIVGLASQAGLALRNVRLVEDLRASRRRIVTAQDERAKKLERNIHDGAQQQLVALSVKLRLLEQTVDRDPAKARAMAAQLGSAANAALEDLRDLARGIYPPLLADQGLGVALEAQARKAAMPVTVISDGIERFGADVESAIYFSCLEALQNAAKHAGDATVELKLWTESGGLLFSVTDDGPGFDPAVARRGHGFVNMADRLGAIGGTVRWDSKPGHGAAVNGSVPLAA
jgi:signal transduction histidine kinase